jgi:hypothetical protein
MVPNSVKAAGAGSAMLPLCASLLIFAGQAPIMSLWCWKKGFEFRVLAARRGSIQEKDEERSVDCRIKDLKRRHFV